MGSETTSKNGVGAAAATTATAEVQFPPGTKKIIQSLKEIVNCPEPEIYSVLKECNMDPNDAVQRLLSLDTFHEVKSKRERRKEMKETQDSKPRVTNNGSIRGIKGSTEHNGGWCGSSQTSSGVILSSFELGKATYKGQNGFVASSPHPSASHLNGGTTSQQPSSHSDSLSTSREPGDAISASAQPSPANESTCFSTNSGNLSMADVVKMGRPSTKGSHISSDTCLHQAAFATNSCSCHVEPEIHQCMHSENSSCASEAIHKPGDAVGQNAFHDEWPAIEHPIVASRSHKVQESEGNFSTENIDSDHNAYASASTRQKMVDASGGRSYCVDDMSSNSSSYDSHRSAYENGEGTRFASNVSYPNHCASNDTVVPSATMNMQQLNLGKEEPADDCEVVLPNNLKELAADCSHLSFGTFRSGPSSALPRSPSNFLKNDMGGSSLGICVSSAGHLDTRNPGYNHDELLGSLYDTGGATIDVRNYGLPLPSQPELIKQDTLEASFRHKGITTSSLPDFNSENIRRASSGLPFDRTDPKFRNIPPPQSDMGYSDSIPSDLLESFSQFLVTPSVPARYSSAVSSVNNLTISMSEALRPGGLPLSEASSVPTQHHTAPSYSQPTLDYDQLASIIGYPSLPQSYSSTTYLGGSASPGMDYNFPQYRSGASISRLAPSAAAIGGGGGHGSFGASNNVHGSLLYNSSTVPLSMSDYSDVLRSQYKDGSHLTPYDDVLRTQYKDGSHLTPYNDVLRTQYKDGSHLTPYDDVLRTQYKDGSHITPLHQSSRTLSSVPDNAYNHLLGQNQQHAGYRQGQAGKLPSQLNHYGSPGYPDFYQSQMGITQDHQRQSLNDIGLGGFQDLSPQQLHQIWQRTY